MPKWTNFLSLAGIDSSAIVKLMNEKESSLKANALHKLYPHWSEEQLKMAEESLEKYLEVSLRIYQHILADPEKYAQFKALTAERRSSRMKGERSNPSQQLN